MKSSLLSALALAAFASAPGLAGQTADEGSARSKVKPPQLVEFTGIREFLKESRRLRVWREEVGYTLRVDTAGHPTECELTQEFRRAYVNKKLCEVLLRHHSFEPAIDDSGAAVESTYEGRLSYLEMRENT